MLSAGDGVCLEPPQPSRQDLRRDAQEKAPRLAEAERAPFAQQVHDADLAPFPQEPQQLIGGAGARRLPRHRLRRGPPRPQDWRAQADPSAPLSIR